MQKIVAASVGGLRVLLLDSITWIGEEDSGEIVVSGSHGGRSAGEYAVLVPLALCCLNDAGVGKDEAGIVALHMLQQRGTPAVAYAHWSARIGEAADGWQHGVVSHLNQAARALGLRADEPLRTAVLRVFSGLQAASSARSGN